MKLPLLSSVMFLSVAAVGAAVTTSPAPVPVSDPVVLPLEKVQPCSGRT